MRLKRVQSGTPSAAAAIKLSTYAPRVGRKVAEYAAPMPAPRTTLRNRCSPADTRAALDSAPAIAPITLRRIKVFIALLCRSLRRAYQWGEIRNLWERCTDAHTSSIHSNSSILTKRAKARFRDRDSSRRESTSQSVV